MSYLVWDNRELIFQDSDDLHEYLLEIGEMESGLYSAFESWWENNEVDFIDIEEIDLMYYLKHGYTVWTQ